MSKPQGSRDFSDTVQDLLTGVAKLLLGLGGLCTVICVALLIMLCMNLANDSSHGTQALQNVELIGRVLLAGVVSIAVGAGYLFWGEDLASGILVLFSVALYCAPLYVPSLLGGSATNTAITAALGAIQQAGTVLGLLSISALAIQVGIKVKQRARIGIRADTLRFGKGIKEEADRQNVFMGNCWQLPYCRKFVRERCPIFHAKRTCWKERVGCMCEEEVIRNAMENKPIPRDAVLAANLIPKNFRLTPQQKFERCKSCVIYNEHQRHKYRLMLPVVLLGFLIVYGALHAPLVAMFGGFVLRVNEVLNSVTQSHGGKIETPQAFVEGLLFVTMLVFFSYSLKALEFVIFKLKI